MTHVSMKHVPEHHYYDTPHIHVRGSLPKQPRDADGTMTRQDYANSMDSQFRYFGETDEEHGLYDHDRNTVIGRIDSEILALLDSVINTNTDCTTHAMTAVPNWNAVRENTFTINAHIDNMKYVMETLHNRHMQTTLFLKATDNPCTEETGRRALKEGMFYEVYDLLNEVNNQNEITMRALHRNIEHMDSMRFLLDTPDTIYESGLKIKLEDGDAVCSDSEDDAIPCPNHSYTNYFHANWYIRARYLSYSLHDVYPLNFRNIVIVGASKMIAKDQLKVTKLQQYLAACGRLDTRLILVD